MYMAIESLLDLRLYLRFVYLISWYTTYANLALLKYVPCTSSKALILNKANMVLLATLLHDTIKYGVIYNINEVFLFSLIVLQKRQKCSIVQI